MQGQELYTEVFRTCMLLYVPTIHTHGTLVQAILKYKSVIHKSDRVCACRAWFALPSPEKLAVKTGQYYFVIFN